MQWCLVQSILVRLSSSVTPLPVTISTEGNMKKESRGKDHKKKGTIRKARKVGGPGPTEPQGWPTIPSFRPPLLLPTESHNPRPISFLCLLWSPYLGFP